MLYGSKQGRQKKKLGMPWVVWKSSNQSRNAERNRTMVHEETNAIQHVSDAFFS